MTIAEAIAGFEQGWVADQAVTPRMSCERTLRALGFWLERSGRTAADDLATLAPADLDAFVRWHGARFRTVRARSLPWRAIRAPSVRLSMQGQTP